MVFRVVTSNGDIGLPGIEKVAAENLCDHITLTFDCLTPQITTPLDYDVWTTIEWSSIYQFK